MYPENPEGTQVIVGSMNMGYISDTARNRTHNLFRPKWEPILLGHCDGQHSGGQHSGSWSVARQTPGNLVWPAHIIERFRKKTSTYWYAMFWWPSAHQKSPGVPPAQSEPVNISVHAVIPPINNI